MTLQPWQISDPAFESDEDRPEFAYAPWAGHRGFAYDLVGFQRPGLIVELGTHYGCSFFAFAQAVKNREMATEIVAVDTWEGDPHAGYYGAEVLEFVTDVVERRFAQQAIRLLATTFDDAVPEVSDGSIDLLHIDGYHTRQAVARDYAAWLPKLAHDGIVLFHDVAETSGYGSAEWWTEISATLPSLTFPHSFGLGVLFPKGDRWLRAIERQGPPGWVQLYSWRAEARLRAAQVRDQERLIEDRDEALASQVQLLEERAARMADMDAAVAARDEAITAQAEMLEERWRILQQQDETIQAQSRQIARLGRMGLRRFLRSPRG